MSDTGGTAAGGGDLLEGLPLDPGGHGGASTSPQRRSKGGLRLQSGGSLRWEPAEDKLKLIESVPLPPLPPNTKPLSHQVAGHVYGKSSSRFGMLECGDGTILKPLPEGCCGERELAFYQRVWGTGNCESTDSSRDIDITRLKIKKASEQSSSGKYIRPEGMRSVPGSTSIPNGCVTSCVKWDLEPEHKFGADDQHRTLEYALKDKKDEDDSGGDSKMDILSLAQRLTPVYLGTFVDPTTPEVQYLRLADLTHGFRRPCIADIKIGRRSYDPEATSDKITKELHKYPPQQQLCFQLKGMRSYCRKLDEFTTCSKEYLRSLGEDAVLNEGFSVFFDNGFGVRQEVVRKSVEKLQPIIEWTALQRSFAFYASSVLVIYEGAFDFCDSHRERAGGEIPHQSDKVPVCDRSRVEATVASTEITREGNKSTVNAGRESSPSSSTAAGMRDCLSSSPRVVGTAALLREKQSDAVEARGAEALGWEELKATASTISGSDGKNDTTSVSVKNHNCMDRREPATHKKDTDRYVAAPDDDCDVKVSEGICQIGRSIINNASLRLPLPPCDADECSCRRVEVKMIDFARVFPTDELDSNYLEGLISLRQHFEKLL